jgi:general secretion pathway protein F/type IV pilus assembly protein PilC
MSEFRYTARDGAGQSVDGTISAANQHEAVAILASRSIFPLELKDATPNVERRQIRRVPATVLAVVYGQLADLLRSGVSLLRALEVVEKQVSHSGLKAVLSEVHRRVEDGSTLADAMSHFETVFGEMAIQMVHAGGEGGFLEEALSRVAEFTETQDDLRKRTLGAVAYPAFLAVVGSIVVIVLVVFFVPRFGEMFARLREQGELPFLTECLLTTSVWIRRLGLPLVAAIGIGGWWARRWLRSDAGRWWHDRLILRLPLAGPILLALAVARFCRVLGTLLHNGVPILRALRISRDATGNRVLAAAIGEATDDISAGQSLAGPLAQSGQFPPLVVEMIAVAEQANNLEGVLLDVANTLERRTWRRLDLAVRLIEPILLLVLAVMVLILVIALLLPIMKMGITV